MINSAPNPDPQQIRVGPLSGLFDLVPPERDNHWEIFKGLSVPITAAEADVGYELISDEGNNLHAPSGSYATAAEALNMIKTKRAVAWMDLCRNEPLGARKALMKSYSQGADDILFCASTSLANVPGGIGAKLMEEGLCFVENERTDDWVMRSLIERDGVVLALAQHYQTRTFTVGTLSVDDDDGMGRLNNHFDLTAQNWQALIQLSKLVNAPSTLKWAGDPSADWYSDSPEIEAALHFCNRSAETMESGLPMHTKAALVSLYQREALARINHHGSLQLALSLDPAEVEGALPVSPIVFIDDDGEQYLASSAITEAGTHLTFDRITIGGQIETIFDQGKQWSLDSVLRLRLDEMRIAQESQNEIGGSAPVP